MTYNLPQFLHIIMTKPMDTQLKDGTESHKTPEKQTKNASKTKPPLLEKKQPCEKWQTQFDGANTNLNITFKKIPIHKKCVKPNCNCVQKRGKPPEKYTCSDCLSIYYCCDKMMHACYHYCSTDIPDTIIQQSTGGGTFSKLDKI